MSKIKKNDVVLAKLGIMDMGDGLPPWIPGPKEIKSVKKDLKKVLPKGTKIMVHHFGVELQHFKAKK